MKTSTAQSSMVEIASALGVERVITAQLSHRATETVLKLNAFTRATLAVETSTVQEKGPPRGNFFRSIAGALRPVLQSLSGQLRRRALLPAQLQVVGLVLRAARVRSRIVQLDAIQ